MPPILDPKAVPPFLPKTPLTIPAALWLDDLHRAAQRPLSWLWHGYLVAGAVTLLTSR